MWLFNFTSPNEGYYKDLDYIKVANLKWVEEKSKQLSDTNKVPIEKIAGELLLYKYAIDFCHAELKYKDYSKFRDLYAVNFDTSHLCSIQIMDNESLQHRLHKYLNSKYVSNPDLKPFEYKIIPLIFNDVYRLAKLFSSEGEDSYGPLAIDFVKNVLGLDETNAIMIMIVGLAFSSAPKIITK